MARPILAHSGGACADIYGHGIASADGGAINLLWPATIYGPAVAVWLLVDTWRFYRSERAGATAPSEAPQVVRPAGVAKGTQPRQGWSGGLSGWTRLWLVASAIWIAAWALSADWGCVSVLWDMQRWPWEPVPWCVYRGIDQTYWLNRALIAFAPPVAVAAAFLALKWIRAGFRQSAGRGAQHAEGNPPVT